MCNALVGWLWAPVSVCCCRQRFASPLSLASSRPSRDSPTIVAESAPETTTMGHRALNIPKALFLWLAMVDTAGVQAWTWSALPDSGTDVPAVPSPPRAD